MKKLTDIINEEQEIVEHGEQILLDESVLNLTPKINTKFFYELAEGDKNLAVAKEHLKSHHDIKKTKSTTEILSVALMRYENRTIHIEKEPDYSRLIDIMQSYKTVDFVAGYKRYLFEPLDSKMWEIHKPGGDTRIVFYAWDFKHKGKLKTSNELDSIGEIAEVFGSLATTKRKRYNQYAKRIYRINDKSGLHARPSASFVTLASKYPADIWLRTDSKEVNGKSILGVMTLAATADKPLTVLYKPREKSEEFYNSLESIELNEGKLFTRID